MFTRPIFGNFSGTLRYVVCPGFRLVHDRKLSEDIVQDVFLMLWERRAEIDFSRPVLPF